MTQAITTECLLSMGCRINCYADGSCSAFSHNSYIVANKTNGTWRMANKSKKQWKPVKLRVKAISQQLQGR